jgi:hypothetical protein
MMAYLWNTQVQNGMHPIVNFTTPKDAHVNNKMIPLNRSRAYVHLSCACCSIDVCDHHLLQLVNSLQVFVSYTYNISNVGISKVKQFTGASKLKFFIGNPHSRSFQILLARIVQLVLPLLLHTTYALRRT